MYVCIYIYIYIYIHNIYPVRVRVKKVLRDPGFNETSQGGAADQAASPAIIR